MAHRDPMTFGLSARSFRTQTRSPRHLDEVPAAEFRQIAMLGRHPTPQRHGPGRGSWRQWKDSVSATMSSTTNLRSECLP